MNGVDKAEWQEEQKDREEWQNTKKQANATPEMKARKKCLCSGFLGA